MPVSQSRTLGAGFHEQLGIVPENVISLETLKVFYAETPELNRLIGDYEQRVASGEKVVIYLLGDNQLFIGPPPEMLNVDSGL